LNIQLNYSGMIYISSFKFYSLPGLIFLLRLILVPVNLAAQPVLSASLSDAAIELTHQKVIYDPAYYVIDYPNGDIPEGRGVCSDVIIRAYRKTGIDLQKKVHEDMTLHFSEYPQRWGLSKPDRNIDHRRVPNLMTFFSRKGEELPMDKIANLYMPGDIVCWDLGGGVQHIGLVVNSKSADGKRYLIVHNIGAGQVMEDCLFNFKIIGHFRYNGQ